MTEATMAEPGTDAMADLYTRHVPSAIRLAFLLTGDPHQAEDLAHDAFVRCVGRFGHLRAKEAFDAYLRRAVVNLHTSGLRRTRTERSWLAREGAAEVRRTTAMPDVGAKEDPWRALATLPQRQRAALVLRHYEDLSEHDTADVLRCSVAAVKSLVARGSETLRTALHEGGMLMNDLDRELKDLFETKARGVDASLAAPEAVLRRGRRRQIGVVAGGALGGVAALVVAGSLALALLGDGNDGVPSNQTPNGPYGDRTAIIGGFEVQAPQGWTLIDQWPLASIISVGSTSCTGSFSAVADPVGGASEPTVAQSTALGEEECTTEPASLPAGIPVLQLSTYDPGLMTPVCEVFDEGTGGTLPADGVAVFVTAFPGTKTPEQVQRALVEACPVPPDIESIVQGPSVTYVTATFAGSDADPALLEAAANVTDLGGHDTRAMEPSPLSGPAYVIGSGVTGDERWQVSAGVDFGEGYLSTVWMTSFRADGSVTGTLAQPWSGGNGAVASALDVGDASVAIALIPAGSGDPHWETDRGLEVALEQAPFPSSLAALTLKPVLDGTAAWAEVPDVSGAVVTELAPPTG